MFMDDARARECDAGRVLVLGPRLSPCANSLRVLIADMISSPLDTSARERELDASNDHQRCLPSRFAICSMNLW